MNKHQKLLRTILQFMMLTLVVGYMSINIMDMTYASLDNASWDKRSNPDVTVTINSGGKISQEGNLLVLRDNPSYLWYPGRAADGVLRISNQSNDRVKVSSLGLEVVLAKEDVKSRFLENMHLTIEKGRLLDFDPDSIVSESFTELVKGSVSLESNSQFTLERNDTIDLKYTVKMKEEAGNELQNLTADVKFLINMNGDINVDDDDNDDGDDDPLVEEPVVVIPDIGAHWAHDCIITLLNHRVIEGYPHKEMSIEDYRNGTVNPVTYVYEAVLPERYITRAEAAVLIGEALGLQEVDALLTGYVDYIPSWAKGHVISTTEADIFEGYPFKLFRANKYITREEMITVLTKAFEITLENEGLELTFEDKEEIAAWAEYYVKAGAEDEVIVGYPDNTYKPKANITRAEAFTIICKLLGLHDEHTQGIN
ncbi:S-layer homology domain-containing protein [Anaerosolibacter sp.]|uniref:S-layer homology domain-containing protein n=1 Tax=Anaerosolibacter sp. TaxID=1872527 RepID=UPI0039F05363